MSIWKPGELRAAILSEIPELVEYETRIRGAHARALRSTERIHASRKVYSSKAVSISTVCAGTERLEVCWENESDARLVCTCRSHPDLGEVVSSDERSGSVLLPVTESTLYRFSVELIHKRTSQGIFELRQRRYMETEELTFFSVTIPRSDRARAVSEAATRAEELQLRKRRQDLEELVEASSPVVAVRRYRARLEIEFGRISVEREAKIADLRNRDALYGREVAVLEGLRLRGEITVEEEAERRQHLDEIFEQES